LTTELTTLNSEIQRATDELNHLNDHVKHLEKKILALQATWATQEAEQRQLQHRQSELERCIRVNHERNKTKTPRNSNNNLHKNI